MIEIWKPIKGYDGLYEVSNLGRVKSLNYKNTKKEKILIEGINRGYCYVNLFKNKISKTKYLHRLVAIAFLNHTPCGMKLVVNHINFIKTDNRVENLEIITHRENTNKKHIKSSSFFVGVSWNNKRKKWLSQIEINRKINFLGYFNNENEAHQAYQNKLLTLK
jgi:hypothetical protein